MQEIERRQFGRSGCAMRRETITAAAAIGFLAGGGARMVTGLGDVPHVLLGAVSLSFGAIAAAVLAGLVVNLIALPALSWMLPGRRLQARAYQMAGALSGLAAFAGAFVQFTPAAT